MAPIDDGHPTDADVVWAARQVMRQHAPDGYPPDTVEPGTVGRCWHCTRDGCRMATWAERELAVRGLLPA